MIEGIIEDPAGRDFNVQCRETQTFRMADSLSDKRYVT